MRLRIAAEKDAALLRSWDRQPHIIASKGSEDWGWEHELARSPDWREQLIAEVEDHAIGFIQIIDPQREDGHYWGDCPSNLRAIDIWIGDEAYIGRGFGTQMMQLSLARCFANPNVVAAIVDPLFQNKAARRFYEKCGFRLVERRRFGADDCAVYRIGREEWDEEIT
nr:MAG: GNAT family N-acetyltransferase [Hyphomicrobiales bacterium]